MLHYKSSKVLSLKGSPEYSEKWLQDRIVDDPELLGLGDLTVRDIERRQPRAGRLDLLLADVESGTRYEVEIQLGATDESHIIRTLEYWDIERRRYPQYDHVAVIVAEDITSRFLNVVGLFNGFIPLIAIQLRALEVDGVLTLTATKVMDVVTLGADEEEEDASEPVDRAYWLSRASTETLRVVDRMLDLIRKITGDTSLELKHNKHYIGLARRGVPDNFITFRPRRRSHVLTEFRIPRSDELSSRIEDAGLDQLAYDTRNGVYRLQVRDEDLDANETLVNELVSRASGTPVPETVSMDSDVES